METFIGLNIRDDVRKGVEALGFVTPTPIQTKIIPLMLDRQVDLVGLAQTGTGKTAAFGIPLIQLTDQLSSRTQALVLCPTRELCVQVTKDLITYARYVDGVKIIAVYGGASIEQQINALRRGVQIIVATPGRLLDLIRRNKVDISGIRSIVLDEADEMLQMGFQDELNAILAETPKDKRTLLFSATMPRAVEVIANTYMRNPVQITIGPRNAGAANVRHIYHIAHAKDRYPALKRIIDINPDIYAIIFCRTRQETREVADQLMEEGYSADALHGDLSQSQRDQVMDKFRRRNLRMLVATDVAARGLDVTDLTHVINYNLPDDPGNYTHRSGRTGRAGKSGISISIINLREKYKIAAIESKLKAKFECCRIPGGTEICEKKLLSLIDTMKQIDVSDDQLDPLMSLVADKLAVFDRQELVKRFVYVTFDRLLAYYRKAPDLNVPEKSRKTPAETKKGRPAGRDVAYTRFILNVGKKDGIHPSQLIGEINESVGATRIQIGKIEIMNYSTMLEAESRFADKVRDVFQGRIVNGKPVAIKVAGIEKQPGINGIKGVKEKPFKTRKPFTSARIKGRKKK